MEITSLGHAAFRIKGKKGVVVCDPFDSDMVGLKLPKVTANIVTISHDHKDHNQSGQVKQRGEDQMIVFTGPGEYEVKGIEILGVASFHDEKSGSERGKNIIFKFLIDGLAVVHLGDLGQELTEEQVDLLDGVDILLIPVGGRYTIDARTAIEVIAQLEPSIVIPMHYQRSGLKQDIFKELAPVSHFLKEIGKENIQPQEKLVITHGQLPEDRQVVVLE